MGRGLARTDLRQTAFMVENVLSVPPYNARTGVVAPVEGGTITVEIRDGVVEIFGDPAGLRDLARWCLALSDAAAPSGAHIHLDPGTIPLGLESVSLMLARHPGFSMSSAGLEMAPCGGLVVGAAGLYASVQDADEAVAELA